MVTKRRSSRKVDNPGSSSVESLNDETRLKLLDLQPLKKAFEEVDIITTADKDEKEEEEEEDTDKNDENIGTPKMNTIVGFLRISNFISAMTVVFLLVLNLMTAGTWADDPSQNPESSVLYQNLVTMVQIVFLSFVTLLIAIDSIGTVSFCWREYGELSSLHTDATSVIYILCSNRWIFRLGSGLLLMTALSLPIMKNLEEQNTLPHTLPWIAALVSLSFVSAVFGFLLSLCTPHYRLPWLSGTFDLKLVRDDDDVWKDHGHQFKRPDNDWRQRSKINYYSWLLQLIIQVLGMIFCFTAFVIATCFHVVTLIALTSVWPNQSRWSDVFLLSTILVCIVLELTSMGVLVVRSCKKKCSRNTWSNKSWIPLFIWIIAPHILSCGVREFMRANLTTTLPLALEDLTKYGLILTWTNVMVPMVVLGLFYILIGFFVNGSYVKAFWTINFNSDRTGSRKVIRLMDTIATIFMLVSMIIGFASLFIDQYDIDFDPDGFVKDVVDACKEFGDQINPVMIQLNKVVDAIDKHYTCETVYSVLGTGTALTIFASFFPGAGTVASAGSRSAYYGVRTANALTNLAQRLKRSMSTVWSVSRTVTKVSFFMTKNMNKIILASNSVDIGRMLPLLPPVILGLYVMFGVFWPNRIVFFSAKQRRNHMSKRFLSWTLALIVLLVAILINTIILDELVELLDDNVPIAKVQLKVNLGWKLAMTASALSLFGTFLNWIVALVLMISTNNDHENLTNAEIDWKNELEKRELVTIRTALGNVYQKRTHLKYKRSRISPWTWCLPILLTLMACGFGVLANFYPKMEMIREPRGPFGRQLDKLYRKVSLFENDKDDVVKDTELECLPLATIDDVLHSNNGHHLSNVLMQPVDKFFNMTDIIIGPIKKSLNKFRDNIVSELDDEIFEGNLDEHWQTLKNLKTAQLPYVGLIFTIPRFLCLLILMFGCFMASIFKCNMRIICQSLEPRKIVDAYGKVALFSLIYVLGAQLALVNLLTSFGVPFYHIYVKFSAGFVYDMVADCILMATYIGMNNEFFFAIPKRKTTVTYEVPGVSDPGPNEPGQII